MEAPLWARLLPTPALFPLNPKIELIERRGLLHIDEVDLPTGEYNTESPPGLTGPHQVSEEAIKEFCREHHKRYERFAGNRAKDGLEAVEDEWERIEEEIEAMKWLDEQCANAEDQGDHQLQHRPTYSDTKEESLLEYLEALHGLRQKIARVQVHLQLRWKVLKEAFSHLRRERPAGELMPKDPPYSDPVKEYLRLAYYWYRDGNRCKGDKPAELWKYLAEQTDKTRSAPRERFKVYDWYDPHIHNPTPTDYTRKQILTEGSKYYWSGTTAELME